MLSKKLARHLKKSFGTDDVEGLISKSEKVELLAGLRKFVEAANRAYSEYDERLLVAERNIDISSQELSQSNSRLANVNEAINTMIDSLEEGYFLVNSSGQSQGIYSKICEEIFGGSPSGVHLLDLFNLPLEEKEMLSQWIYLIFDKRLTLEDLSDLGPKSFVNKRGKVFGLTYRLIFDEKGQVKNLVVVASDKTAEIQAHKKAEDKVAEARTILKIVEDRDQFQGFYKTLTEMVKSLSKQSSRPDWDQVRFGLHTLKGGASTFYMNDLETLLHESEVKIKEMISSGEGPNISLMELCQNIQKLADQFVDKFQRVLGDKESWMDQIVFDSNDLLTIIRNTDRANVPADFLNALLTNLMGMDVADLMSGYRSTIQVTADRISKPLNPLEIRGSGLRIPAEPYRKFFSSLVHLFRNAVDHGIEDENTRIGSGKPSKGTVFVDFGMGAQKSSWWLKVWDDGRGVDCSALRKKWSERDGIDPQGISDQDVLDHLLDISISSKCSEDETSGMGVGLGAVGQAVKELGGTYRVSSQAGEGTCFYFELPLISWCSLLETHQDKAA